MVTLRQSSRGRRTHTHTYTQKTHVSRPPLHPHTSLLSPLPAALSYLPLLPHWPPQDMIREAMQGPPDPLYTMDVPDHSSFVYERDTPLVPVPTLSGPSHNPLPLPPYQVGDGPTSDFSDMLRRPPPNVAITEPIMWMCVCMYSVK